MQWQGSPAATVLYDDRVIALDGIADDPRRSPEALWIRESDLPRVNGFELTAHGACRGDVCLPIAPEMRRGDRVDLAAFARHAGQPVVAEPDAGVWSIGEMPALGDGLAASRVAPDVEVPDRAGRPVRLSAFRGKQVLVLTWASW